MEGEVDEINLAANSFQRRKERPRVRSAEDIEVSDRLVELFEEELSKAVPIRDEQLATIYRVPPELGDSDEDGKKFYKPKVVSIGPYHKGRKKKLLVPMQDHKWICLNTLIFNIPHREGSRSLLRKCFEKMFLHETAIRERYSKEIELSRTDLAVRMLLDGGFILYLLLKEAKEIPIELHDVQFVIGRVWIWELVKYDLLLLENQIPFFVIMDLRDILAPGFKLVDIALTYFSSLDPCRKQAQSPFYTPEEQVRHLLHLVYLSVLPCPQYYKHSLNPSSQQWIPGVTELEDFGVKFKKRTKEGCFLSFLDIKFNDRVLEIPQLRVHDYSVSLLRNLVAFEQCFPDTTCHITAYAQLMNCLIDKEEDMRSLRLNKILVSDITTEKDAEHFFRRLCSGAHCAPEKNYLGALINDVNYYYERRWPEQPGRYIRKYLRNPWPILALLVSVFALSFAIIQGIISIYLNVRRH